MEEEYVQYPAIYFTATIHEWKPLPANDSYKDIIIDSLQTLVTKKRIELNAFVIMNNHMHLIWQSLQNSTPKSGFLYEVYSTTIITSPV